MEFWYFLTLSALFIAGNQGKTYNAMENEALIVPCLGSKTLKPEYQVYWTYYKSNKNITTIKRNRIYSSGNELKFLPTSVNDSGIYNCTIKSPKFSIGRYVNITIYSKPQGCNVPKDLLYMQATGTYIRSMIFCPTVELYNETAHVDWFKDCKALKGQDYFAKADYLIIKRPTAADAGIYTCKFIYNENGINYNVTASRPLIIQGESNYSMLPEIIYPVNHGFEEVELGTNVSMPCKVCFGKGLQMIKTAGWCIKEKNLINCNKNSRFQEEKNESKLNENLNCITIILKISNVKKEDLSLEFNCWALNEHGVKEHSIRIRIKKTNGKIYDAYIIYPRNHKSRTERVNCMEYFVHQILPEVLEKKCGYSLCICERDLLPGEDAASEMVKCIQKSRRQIFILNPQVEHGEEFAYEQQIALYCSLMQNDSKVILIEMETTGDTRELHDSLKHIIKHQGTIKWKGEYVISKQSINSNFWKRVRYLMPARSKSLNPLHSGM
ncbi:interleukin-1 receptor-like 1 isoform X2 [Macrotis lagotis]|uniref:interleukin-1 receptor-like 1 isoform X2 n=1 Tax=Macrotis lagotis TaxID=92651 RepID=UPI003D699FBD